MMGGANAEGVRDEWVPPKGGARAPQASRPTAQACPCLPELEGVKFRAWLLARCGLWLGQNICLLLWLPYT